MLIQMPFTLEELIVAFPLSRPTSLPLTDSYDDAVTETEPFRDLNWLCVTGDLLRAKFEAPFFLSPEAIHYFLPAFVKCSLDDLEGVLLPLDNLLSCLSPTNNLSWMKWAQSRWERLSEEQWKILLKWLSWLKLATTVNQLHNLDSAYDAVAQKIWHK
jgi:hypothetical protein